MTNLLTNIMQSSRKKKKKDPELNWGRKEHEFKKKKNWSGEEDKVTHC